MRYRLLVTDLDGTLLDRRGRVSQGNRNAIRRAREAGLEVVVATGRSWMEARSVVEEAGIEGLCIAVGGASLHSATDGSVVHTFDMCPDAAHACASTISEHGHVAHVFRDATRAGHDYLLVGSHDLHPVSDWWFKEFPVTVERIACPTHWQPGAHAHSVLRAGTVAGAHELPALVERLRERVGDAVTMQHWGAVTQDMSIGTQTHVLEIFAAGVDKWTMIEHVCALRGFGTDQVAAVGDGMNDLGMLRAAALGISMENAHEHAHAAANVRVGHHDRDGFAEAVELVLGHR